MLVKGHKLYSFEGFLYIIESEEMKVSQLLPLDKVLIHRQWCHLCSWWGTHYLDSVKLALGLEIRQSANCVEGSLRKKQVVNIMFSDCLRYDVQMLHTVSLIYSTVEHKRDRAHFENVRVRNEPIWILNRSAKEAQKPYIRGIADHFHFHS